MPTDVGVVGVGYVGLTTAAGLAHLGHRVHAVDVNEARVAQLRCGRIPLPEPDLDTLVTAELASGRLSFGTDHAGLRRCEIVFVSVPTPMGEGGAADLRAIYDVADRLAGTLRPGAIVVDKSTVPVGTAARLADLLAAQGIRVVSNPEFLRESHAVEDFLRPDRVVIGAADRAAGERVARLFAPLAVPIRHTDFESAELAKYASNAYLALRLSFVNELAELCEHVGADVRSVTECMGLDSRIGPDFLRPGPGWGGSCLPKDTEALLQIAAAARCELTSVRAAVTANGAQVARVLRKIRQAATGRPEGSLYRTRIGVLGLSFKAGTADLRHSPAIRVVRSLVADRAQVTAYDPLVDPDAAVRSGELDDVQVVTDPYLVGKGAATIVVLTEWPEFADLDWLQVGEAMDRRTLVDTRNLLDAAALERAGFVVIGNGTRH